MAQTKEQKQRAAFERQLRAIDREIRFWALSQKHYKPETATQEGFVEHWPRLVEIVKKQVTPLCRNVSGLVLKLGYYGLTIETEGIGKFRIEALSQSGTPSVIRLVEVGS